MTESTANGKRATQRPADAEGASVRAESRDFGFILGLQEIGEALGGRCAETVRRLIDRQGLPAARIDGRLKGQFVTSTRLLDAWLLDLAQQQRQQR